MTRIIADTDMCQGNANCIMVAGDVFDLNDDGVVSVLVGEVPADRAEAVRAAVQGCPVGALALSDE